MNIATRELYRSPNGDRWCLAREPGQGRPFVLHEPNLPSGGRSARIELAAFLARGDGPEQQALLRLIADLVDDEAEAVLRDLTGVA